MKKSLTIAFAITILGIIACTNKTKSDKEIDSLNESSADSLLNAALADTTITADTLKKDSIAE
jgi:hypothetical protein